MGRCFGNTIVVILVVCLAQGAWGQDVVIDDFSAATNTVEVTVPGNSSSDQTDVGLPVIGGTRQILVEDLSAFSFGTEGGVDLSTETLRIMQLGGIGGMGDGRVTATYDGGGAGLGDLISCATSIEVSFSSDEVDVGSLSIEVMDGGGGSGTVTFPIPQGSGVLSFSVADFAGVDFSDVSELSVILDMEVQANDYSIGLIGAACPEPPDVPAPAPAIGTTSLALSSFALFLFGFLGIARRRRL